MSNNPFSDLPPGENPYQPPQFVPEGGGWNRSLTSAEARTAIMPFAITLLILAMPTIALQALSLAVTLPGYIASEMPLSRIISMTIGNVACVLMNIAIIWGMVCALRLRSYRSAQVAAIIALIPLCSPCFVLGIPFGIWGLIVLNRSQIKTAFLS